ncbi:MAG: rhomboid family intramembrane serine protease [Chloroflexota bacterium]
MNDYPPVSDSPQTAPPQQPVRVPLPQSAPYVTYTIIGVTIAFYLMQIGSVLLFGYPTSYGNIDWLELFGARINDFIRAGQIWRLFTPALLHGSIPHIFFNMYALYSLGTGLERYFGRNRFLLLYVLGAFTGNVTSFLFTNGYSVGASTAIFGLIGAEAVFLIQNRKMFAGQFNRAIGNVIFVILINLFLVGSIPGIDNWGHVGGLIGGLMFTSFAGPVWEVESSFLGYSLVDKRSAREMITGAAVVAFIFGALALWGMVR